MSPQSSPPPPPSKRWGTVFRAMNKMSCLRQQTIEFVLTDTSLVPVTENLHHIIREPPTGHTPIRGIKKISPTTIFRATNHTSASFFAVDVFFGQQTSDNFSYLNHSCPSLLELLGTYFHLLEFPNKCVRYMNCNLAVTKSKTKNATIRPNYLGKY